MYTFKIASEDSEFEQIFRLNYETFVEEIPQHQQNEERRLVDKFHDENTYLISLNQEGQLVGMMAVRDQRPFSLDSKLPDLDDYLPEGRSKVEIRLLAVPPRARTGRVLKGLLNLLVEHNKEKHWDLAVISGTTRQLKLYRRMGYKPFGPVVGSGDALYQPMFNRLEDFQKHTSNLVDHQPQTLCFLPGPVSIPGEVNSAFHRPAISHRGSEFKSQLHECRQRLCRLTGANHALVAVGSGTLANEMVAAHLGQLNGRGVIFSNGEFGDRLIKQGERFNLEFDTLTVPWGDQFDPDAVDLMLESKDPDWVWVTACETSTGMKNDIDRIAKESQEREIKLCVDCVSAVGAYSLDLSQVYLGTGTGSKALSAYPGLALVFHNHEIESDDQIPGYLDIGHYRKHGGVPYTHSSNLVGALNVALERFADADRLFAKTEELNRQLRAGLDELALPVLTGAAHSSPTVVTIPLPDPINSVEFAKQLKAAGIEIAGESQYLVERNWVQICLMGVIVPADIEILLERLAAVLSA